MQVDIREQWGYDPTLRRTAVGVVIYPVLNISGLQYFPYELDKFSVLDFAAYLADQNMMVNIIKAAFA